MSTVFPTSGKTFLAKAAKEMAATLYVAIGNGDAGWGESPPDPSSGDTTLTAEVGRVLAAEVAYATPDAGGTIETDLGTFTASVSPTNYLYIRGVISKTSAVGETIREAGVFGACEPPVGAAANDFIDPDDMEDSGILLGVSRFVGFVRSATESQTFEFVIEL